LDNNDFRRKIILAELNLNPMVMEPPLLSDAFITNTQLKLSIAKLYFKKTKITSIFFINFKKI
jgi:hypothetical protein